MLWSVSVATNPFFGFLKSIFQGGKRIVVAHEYERHPRPKMPEVQTIDAEVEIANQEEWIDLFCLLQDTAINTITRRAVLWFEYDDDEKHDKTLIYQLRVALRAVGHKIEHICYNIEHVGGDNIAKVIGVEIETTIPESVMKGVNTLYRKWAAETKSHNHVESDSESESESDEPDENPSN